MSTERHQKPLFHRFRNLHKATSRAVELRFKTLGDRAPTICRRHGMQQLWRPMPFCHFREAPSSRFIRFSWAPSSFERLHPPERAATRQRAQVSPGLLTCCAPFSEYTQHSSPEAWQAVHRSPPTNSTPNSVSIIRPIWPQSLCLFGPMAANPTANCNHHLPWAVGAYAAVALPWGAQAHGRRMGSAR